MELLQKHFNTDLPPLRQREFKSDKEKIEPVEPTAGAVHRSHLEHHQPGYDRYQLRQSLWMLLINFTAREKGV
jgi:hypothetical protein